jgi:hypothetical protein
VANGMHASRRDSFLVLLQALPASLRVLHASTAPVELLLQLTALEALTLDEKEDAAPVTCRLSALQRLTMLQLGHWVGKAELDMIGGCTSLRTLCLRGASFALVSDQVEHAILHCTAWPILL